MVGFVYGPEAALPSQGVTVLNTPCLIDSHYRGELKVALINLDPSNFFEVNPGDRIAQVVIQKVENVVWRCGRSLDETERTRRFRIQRRCLTVSSTCSNQSNNTPLMAADAINGAIANSVCVSLDC